MRFLAKGDYLSEVGDVHGISISSACRVVHAVCGAICARVKNINFPSTDVELMNIKQGFFEIADFPNVVGAIDGTLVPIQGMTGEDEPNFVCRKGYHAINVQAVVDLRLR